MSDDIGPMARVHEEMRQQAYETIAVGVRVMLAKQLIDRGLTPDERAWVRDGWVPATLTDTYQNGEVAR